MKVYRKGITLVLWTPSACYLSCVLSYLLHGEHIRVSHSQHHSLGTPARQNCNTIFKFGAPINFAGQKSLVNRTQSYGSKRGSNHPPLPPTSCCCRISAPYPLTPPPPLPPAGPPDDNCRLSPLIIRMKNVPRLLQTHSITPYR